MARRRFDAGDHEGEGFVLHFGHALANTFLIGEGGEKKWRVSIVKNGLKSALGDVFAFLVQANGVSFGPYRNAYDVDNTVQYLIPLRTFASDKLKVYLEFKHL